MKSDLHCRRPQLDPWVGKVPWRRVGSPPQCSRFPGGSPGVDDADGNPRVSLTATGKASLLSWLPSATVLRVTCWVWATRLWFRQPQVQKAGVLVSPDYREGGRHAWEETRSGNFTRCGPSMERVRREEMSGCDRSPQE